MKKLFYYGDLFMSKSDWRDMALVKFCLFSLGLLAGTRVPGEKHRPARLASSLVFMCTYIPLMVKLFRVIMESIGSGEE